MTSVQRFLFGFNLLCLSIIAATFSVVVGDHATHVRVVLDALVAVLLLYFLSRKRARIHLLLLQT